MTRRKLAISLLLSLTMSGWGQPSGEEPWVDLAESVPLETEQVLDDPAIRSTQEVWLDLIDRSRDRLDLEFFYLRNEQPNSSLTPIVEALEKRAAQGLKIRVLVDARFTKTYPELVREWPDKGIEVRQLRLLDGVQHGKLMLVDGQYFFLGSQNFDWTALTHIRELGIWGRHPGLARQYQQVFEVDWSRAASGEARPPAEVAGEHAWSEASYRSKAVRVRGWWSPGEEESALVDLLTGARQSIAVQVMTYSPAVVHHDQPSEPPGYYCVLDGQLRAAATRGVRVQLLVADWGLKAPHLAHLRSLDCLPNLEVRFSKMPVWSGGPVAFGRVGHSKYLVVDGQRGWVGTSNWEKSYFHQCRDFGLTFEGESLGAALQRFFERDWNGPYAASLPPET